MRDHDDFGFMRSTVCVLLVAAHISMSACSPTTKEEPDPGVHWWESGEIERGACSLEPAEFPEPGPGASSEPTGALAEPVEVGVVCPELLQVQDVDGGNDHVMVTFDDGSQRVVGRLDAFTGEQFQRAVEGFYALDLSGTPELECHQTSNYLKSRGKMIAHGSVVWLAGEIPLRDGVVGVWGYDVQRRETVAAVELSSRDYFYSEPSVNAVTSRGQVIMVGLFAPRSDLTGPGGTYLAALSAESGALEWVVEYDDIPLVREQDNRSIHWVREDVESGSLLVRMARSVIARFDHCGELLGVTRLEFEPDRLSEDQLMILRDGYVIDQLTGSRIRSDPVSVFDTKGRRLREFDNCANLVRLRDDLFACSRTSFPKSEIQWFNAKGEDLGITDVSSWGERWVAQEGIETDIGGSYVEYLVAMDRDTLVGALRAAHCCMSSMDVTFLFVYDVQSKTYSYTRTTADFELPGGETRTFSAYVNELFHTSGGRVAFLFGPNFWVWDTQVGLGEAPAYGAGAWRGSMSNVPPPIRP